MTLKKIFTPIIMAIIFVSLILLGNMTLSSNAGNKESGTVQLRLGQAKAATHPVSQGIDRFAKLVKEKSNGEIVVETFHFFLCRFIDFNAIIYELLFGLCFTFVRHFTLPFCCLFSSFHNNFLMVL